MRVYISEEETTVGEAPIGLLKLVSGEIIVKSEYSKDGVCECIIVSSGEYFWGEGNAAKCVPLVIQ